MKEKQKRLCVKLQLWGLAWVSPTQIDAVYAPSQPLLINSDCVTSHQYGDTEQKIPARLHSVYIHFIRKKEQGEEKEKAVYILIQKEYTEEKIFIFFFFDSGLSKHRQKTKSSK